MKKAFGLLLILVLVGCAKKMQPIQDMKTDTIVPFYQTTPINITSIPNAAPVRVGMLLPLSGKYKKLGEDLRDAGVLAQFEVASDNFKLFFYDTQGTADGAADAFIKAKEEQVQVILGPVFSHEVERIASVARRSNIPVFSFTSDKTNLGDGVYSLALTIENQTERIIRFACEKGATRLTIMAPDNKAGDIAIDAATKTAKACGMDISHLSVYNPTFINFDPYVVAALPEDFVQERKSKRQEKKDLRSGLLKRKEETEPVEKAETDEETTEQTEPLTVAEQLDFDALFIADDGNRLKSLSSLFGLYDVTPDDVLFLGLSTWNDVSLSREGSLKNAYYPSLPVRGYSTFTKRFEDTYGKVPNRLASLSYDSVALVAALTGNQMWEDYMLANQMGYLGTDGLFRFNEDGTVERLMGIYQIQGENLFSRIERPSKTFIEEDEKKEGLEKIRVLNATRDTEDLEEENIIQETMTEEVMLTD